MARASRRRAHPRAAGREPERRRRSLPCPGSVLADRGRPESSHSGPRGRRVRLRAQPVSLSYNFLGHTRFGAVEWRPDEGVRRTVGE